MGVGVERGKCELCGTKAVLRCDADAASLCRDCDAEVHGANFLVARHVRTVLCSSCDRPSRECVSGPSPPCPARLCRFCMASGPPPADGSPESCRGDRPARLVSTAESAVLGTVSGSCCSLAECAENVRAEEAEIQSRVPAASVGEAPPLEKMEAILRRWHGRLNLRSRYTVPLAMHLLAKALPRIGGGWINAGMRYKVRICLAASLWMAAKLSERRLVALKNIEECARVPSKLVVLGEIKMWKKVATAEQEGWAECCH